jgi:transcriptional regulator of acetoin/glycerol metabolism
MLSLQQASAYPHVLHANDLFALPWQMLHDAAKVHATHLDVPLWSGLRLVATPQRVGASGQAPARPADAAASAAVPLKTIEDTLIRRAVEQARGNVAQAAKALGISRATLYRKLGKKPD